jgi:hypothetical protein
MTSNRSFLILDLDTGRMDGWYKAEQDAAWAAEQRRAKVGGRWIVTELSTPLGHKTTLNPMLTSISDLEMDLR